MPLNIREAYRQRRYRRHHRRRIQIQQMPPVEQEIQIEFEIVILYQQQSPREERRRRLRRIVRRVMQSMPESNGDVCLSPKGEKSERNVKFHLS